MIWENFENQLVELSVDVNLTSLLNKSIKELHKYKKNTKQLMSITKKGYTTHNPMVCGFRAGHFKFGDIV